MYLNYIKFLLLLLSFSVTVSSAENNVGTENKKWVLGPFVRPDKKNPVISPLETSFYCPMRKVYVKWEESDTFNPAAVLRDGSIIVMYRAEDNSAKGIGQRTSRIGYAESEDGITMVRRKEPVLYPAEDNNRQYEWNGGCEDPRVVVSEEGMYVMLYTGWNRDNKNIAVRPRLCVAISNDLLHWEKKGHPFARSVHPEFRDMECKSASIITKIKNGKIVAAKVNGKYWMYFGEQAVCAATSVDLVNWEPVTDENGNLLKLILPREGCFDSQLTECGPPALLTEDGIVLIYNGKNAVGNKGDINYPKGTYAAGQILFDADNPINVVDRLDKPFFWPQADFEKSGQYPDGTVFTEGLVYKDGKLYLYYGCADSHVAVAVCKYKK